MKLIIFIAYFYQKKTSIPFTLLTHTYTESKINNLKRLYSIFQTGKLEKVKKKINVYI